ncbi:aminodeoxychorismate synthase component I [Sphingopyxis sp.]|uniref:aminodeoxychorismate synthase component I n=1 Tax=Sphingopyxis sp. TaxID=1908224 RepID=UPI002D78053A|nr:aminodeoxychorismate synthase component I [Sphingopyxis sp.]HET6523105.1 aminodeoxychorismate synthase component I [Sphingopyxis sp.]
MQLPHPDQAFALFDDARLSGAAPGRLYRDPVEVIAAYRQEDVQSALDRLAKAGEQGFHAAGFISYEAGLALESKLRPLAARRSLGESSPLLWFGLFTDLEIIPARALPKILPDPFGACIDGFHPLISEASYRAAFARVQKLIQAGDIYQANLTFACEVRFSGDPMALYAAVRPRQHAGYGAIINTGAQSVLSFSPELFFSNMRGRLTARPMKGTAPRDPDPKRDAALVRWLRQDIKQRAENLMIVDLLRNDLSRVSRAGSVTVPDMFKVETYPTVHQLVSTVCADLLPELGTVDALRALFPCGSITGAPKLRAMEVIAAVEASSRGVYTGSIGWIDPQGDAVFNVAIRTLNIENGGSVARFGLGSGIVADSDVESEWEECLSKGRFLSPAMAPTSKRP